MAVLTYNGTLIILVGVELIGLSGATESVMRLLDHVVFSVGHFSLFKSLFEDVHIRIVFQIHLHY